MLILLTWKFPSIEEIDEESCSSDLVISGVPENVEVRLKSILDSIGVFVYVGSCTDDFGEG
jgi:hypothetical protein